MLCAILPFGGQAQVARSPAHCEKGHFIFLYDFSNSTDRELDDQIVASIHNLVEQTSLAFPRATFLSDWVWFGGKRRIERSLAYFRLDVQFLAVPEEKSLGNFAHFYGALEDAHTLTREYLSGTKEGHAIVVLLSDGGYKPYRTFEEGIRSEITSDHAELVSRLLDLDRERVRFFSIKVPNDSGKQNLASLGPVFDWTDKNKIFAHLRALLECPA